MPLDTVEMDTLEDPRILQKEHARNRLPAALSRRGLLSAGLASLAGCAPLPVEDRSKPRTPANGPVGPDSEPEPVINRPPEESQLDDRDRLLLLLNRATYGFTRTTFSDAAALGYAGYLEQQLQPQAIDDSAAQARLAPLTTLNMTSQQLYAAYAQMQQQVPAQQLIAAALLRAVYSKRQLLERMVEFWTDHFNINIQDGISRLLKTADDRDVIRVNALGRFPDLLRASARSAAMLFFLDNQTNVVGAPQENYARELMELHSIGVNGGYTQADVRAVARCFTGWQFRQPQSGQFGQFIFNAGAHDTGQKIVLGNIIPAGGGVSDGETVLTILANHPSAAAFISRKLCKRFVGPNPPESLLLSVAATYTATGGDIKAMLRVILSADTLVYVGEPKFKRPFHLMASLLRALGAEVPALNARPLTDRLAQMGHLPFNWPAPDGYPDTTAAWGASLMPRWQFVIALLDGQIPAAAFDLNAWLNSATAFNPGRFGDAVGELLTGGQLAQRTVEAIDRCWLEGPPPSGLRSRDAVGIGAAAEEYQWY